MSRLPAPRSPAGRGTARAVDVDCVDEGRGPAPRARLAPRVRDPPLTVYEVGSTKLGLF